MEMTPPSHYLDEMPPITRSAAARSNIILNIPLISIPRRRKNKAPLVFDVRRSIKSTQTSPKDRAGDITTPVGRMTMKKTALLAKIKAVGFYLNTSLMIKRFYIWLS